MLELCMSGQALSMLRRSALAHTMNAFIGRFMCSPPSATPLVAPAELLFDLEPPPDDLGDLSNENPRATGPAKWQNLVDLTELVSGLPQSRLFCRSVASCMIRNREA